MAARALKFKVGGLVPPTDDHVYVVRPEDEQCREHLELGNWVHVVGSFTMGKTSLVVRECHRLQGKARLRYAYVDLLGHVGKQRDFRAWVNRLIEVLTERLELNPIGNSGSESQIPSQDLVRHGFEYLLRAVKGPLIVVLDEVAFLEELDYVEDICTAFRTMHEDRSGEHHADLRRLTICFAGRRPLYELAPPTSGSSSPFGELLRMPDFPRDEQTIQAIVKGLPDTFSEPEGVVGNILERTGGQPYMTIYLANRAVRERLSTVQQMDDLYERFLAEERAQPSQVLKQIERVLLSDPMQRLAALRTYRRLLADNAEGRQTTAQGAELLVASGLVRERGTGSGRELEIKSDLFRRHFDAAWLDTALNQAADRGQTTARFTTSPQNAGKRICVINTGGTIGMVQRGNKVMPPENPEEFMDYYGEIQELAEDVSFIPLFNKDSINVYPSDWTAIAETIYAERNSGYNGFVVAHGTDTMAFSASAVAFALGSNLRFPVVFTGAQTTPDVRHGDARSNLYRACMVALEDIPEVVISFGNYVFRGCRAQKKDERRFDAFESPTYPPLAHITEVIEVQEHLLRAKVEVDRARLRYLPDPTKDIEVRASFASGVLQIVQYPGLEPDFVDALLDLKSSTGGPMLRGVILQTLGAGNVASEHPYSFIPFITKARDAGVPVLIASQFPSYLSTDTRFAPAEAPIKAGAIPTGNMTTAAVVTKFRWVLAQVDEAVEKHVIRPDQRVTTIENMMNTNYIGELDEELPVRTTKGVLSA